MIDLSKPKREKQDDDWNPVIQVLVLALTAAFLTVIILSGIAGEYIF